MGTRLRSLRVALVAALGGFLLGFDATVISGAVPFIRQYFGLNGAAGSIGLGWTVSCLGWGAIAGNLGAGALNDRIGRRRVLQLTAVLFLASSLLAAAAHSYPWFIAARVLGGLGVGGAILTVPMYIAEIAPAARRGSLVAINQLMIVIGISVSFFSNDLLLSIGVNSWRWMLGVEAVPATVFLTLLMGVPESPRWLLGLARTGQALQVMRRLHGDQAEFELAHLPPPADRTRRWRGLFARRMRYVLVFCGGLAFFQQITGINAIFYYLPMIFAQSGGDLKGAFRQSVIVGAVNVLMTLAAMRWIDRRGRKPLLLAGTAGMAVALLTISWAFHGGPPMRHSAVVLAALVTYVASFALSLGPVMWVMIAELFPNTQRAYAISAVGFWNSLISATVTLVFPWEITQWGAAGTFLGYGIMAIAAFVFVAVLCPETRGKTLEEIEALYLDKSIWSAAWGRPEVRMAKSGNRATDNPRALA